MGGLYPIVRERVKDPDEVEDRIVDASTLIGLISLPIGLLKCF